MKLPSRFVCFALVVAPLFAFATTSRLAAATLTQQIDPPEISLGDQAVVTFTVQNGSVKKKDTSTIFGMMMSGADITLPPVDGLQSVLSTTQFMSINGTSSTTVAFTLIPARSGDFTIPAFDIPLQEGGTLRTKPIKLHVLDTGVSPSTNSTPTPAVPSPIPPSIPATNSPFNPNGPVIMPTPNATTAPATPDNGNPADSKVPNIDAPRDKDGGPAKVFIIITPQITDAYVGQSIPMRIDFFIRMDVAANQNSLPTIKGSDFLMNDFKTRGHIGHEILEDKQYVRETWMTAITAPRSGDFPLSMVRDTYWVKSITGNGNGFFGGFFSRRANLAHLPITSNELIMHVHPLPEVGQPPHFSGAIGQFQVTGDAQPASVAVGEPVTLYFSVSGEGNFDYVRCPVLPDNPAWKAYVPSSKTNYRDESRTHAIKTFEQSVIPQKNGKVQIPPATFSYFDPTTKQYVTLPIPLPEITVTGSSIPLASTSPAAGGTDSATATPLSKTDELVPNRLEIGSTQMNLTPVYRQTWFWVAQGGLISLPLLGALILFLCFRATPDNSRAERALRQRSLHQEEDAMAEAVRCGDALAFFVAARHAIQLQLGAQWKLSPEALTLGEIRGRDPHLAETLEPLFKQADEVIYSGQASPGLDLAQWEHLVREELLQPQPA